MLERLPYFRLHVADYLLDTRELGLEEHGIYCLLMLQHDFVAASANIENLDPEAAGLPIALKRIDNAGLRTVMSNSFGFGGTNASLVLRKL